MKTRSPVFYDITSRRIDLLKLTDKTCKFPVAWEGRHLFCGMPVASLGSYCPHHAQRASGGYSARLVGARLR